MEKQIVIRKGENGYVMEVTGNFLTKKFWVSIGPNELHEDLDFAIKELDISPKQMYNSGLAGTNTQVNHG